MSAEALPQVTTTGEPAAPGAGPGGARRRLLLAAALAVALGCLFFGYLRMARGYPTNSDGAGNALQAWDILHGNPLLRGWTLSDVSFYTTELLLHAAVEMVVGLSADVVHIGAAVAYTLLVLLVALVARGRARGRVAALRIGVALALMLAPAPGIAYLTLLSSPDHTGTGVPLLLTWLVLEYALTVRDGTPREGAARWWLPVALALLLAWGEVGDPLVAYTGALPLVTVGAWRVLRGGGGDRPWWRRLYGLDGRLVLAAVASIGLAGAFVRAIRAAGGFTVYPVVVDFSHVSQLPARARGTVRLLAEVFGGYLPDRHGPLQIALGVLHLAGLPLVALALLVVAYRAVRHGLLPGGADRVSALLAVGAVANLGAYLVSTLPLDINGSREVVAVLPLGAALAGRVFGPSLTRIRVGRYALAGVLAVMCVAFTAQAVTAPGPVAHAVGQQQADWLVANGYTYGLGTYWESNSITLASRGRVHVAPVQSGGKFSAYHWESRAGWYDPRHHDARFLLLDLRAVSPADLSRLSTQFGPPARTQQFSRYSVAYLYDHNILGALK